MLVIFPALNISASFKYSSGRRLKALREAEAADAAFPGKNGIGLAPSPGRSLQRFPVPAPAAQKKRAGQRAAVRSGKRGSYGMECSLKKIRAVTGRSCI